APLAAGRSSPPITLPTVWTSVATVIGAILALPGHGARLRQQPAASDQVAGASRRTGNRPGRRIGPAARRPRLVDPDVAQPVPRSERPAQALRIRVCDRQRRRAELVEPLDRSPDVLLGRGPERVDGNGQIDAARMFFRLLLADHDGARNQLGELGGAFAQLDDGGDVLEHLGTAEPRQADRRALRLRGLARRRSPAGADGAGARERPGPAPPLAPPPAPRSLQAVPAGRPRTTDGTAEKDQREPPAASPREEHGLGQRPGKVGPPRGCVRKRRAPLPGV